MMWTLSMQAAQLAVVTATKGGWICRTNTTQNWGGDDTFTP
jgi:hypothetical protein